MKYILLRFTFIMVLSLVCRGAFGQKGYQSIDSLAQECLRALKTNSYTDFCNATMPLASDFEEIFRSDSLKREQLLGSLKTQPGWEKRALGQAQFKFISLRQSKIGGVKVLVDSLTLKKVDFAIPQPSHSYSGLQATSIRLVLVAESKFVKIDLGRAVKTTRGWVLMESPE